MIANKTPMLAGILFAFLATATILPLAAAQVYPTEKSAATLEEDLALARQKIAEVKAHPGGSGTPFLDANGVVGSSLIVGTVFGGIFIAFLVQAKRHAMVKIQ